MISISLLFLNLLLSALTTALIPQIDSIHPSLDLPSTHASPLSAKLTCYTEPLTKPSPIGGTAVLQDCYTAVRLVLAERNILEPQDFDKIGDYMRRKVPYYKSYKSCLFILDTVDPSGEGEFPLIRPAYYAAELIQPCVARKKLPLGGQVQLDVGSFFVAVVGLGPRGLDEGVEGRGHGGGNGSYVESVVEEVRRRARRLEIESR